RRPCLADARVRPDAAHGRGPGGRQARRLPRERRRGLHHGAGDRDRRGPDVSEAARVVVTGIGSCSAIGNDLDTVRAALAQGRGGMVAVPEWPERYRRHTGVAGLVQGISAKLYARRKIRTMGRVALLATYATEQAVADAGLEF